MAICNYLTWVRAPDHLMPCYLSRTCLGWYLMQHIVAEENLVIHHMQWTLTACYVNLIFTCHIMPPIPMQLRDGLEDETGILVVLVIASSWDLFPSRCCEAAWKYFLHPWSAAVLDVFALHHLPWTAGACHLAWNMLGFLSSFIELHGVRIRWSKALHPAVASPVVCSPLAQRLPAHCSRLHGIWLTWTNMTALDGILAGAGIANHLKLHYALHPSRLSHKQFCHVLPSRYRALLPTKTIYLMTKQHLSTTKKEVQIQQMLLDGLVFRSQQPFCWKTMDLVWWKNGLNANKSKRMSDGSRTYSAEGCGWDTVSKLGHFPVLSFALNATQKHHPCHLVPRLSHESTVNVTKCNASHAKGAGVNSDQARQRRATRMDCTPQGLAMVRRMVSASAGWIALQKKKGTRRNLNVRIIDCIIDLSYTNYAEIISARNCTIFCRNHAVSLSG